MEETVFPYQNQQNKSKKMKKVIVIVGMIVLVVALVGIFIIRQPKKTEVKKDVVIENKEPSPTEQPKIDKTTVKIQVLNGTGTPGQAGIVVKALEDAGYSADNIKSSNAQNYDNKTTTITARTNFEEIANDIKSVLTPTFDGITVGPSTLADDSAFDVVVVTGGKIFETVTPTTSVTGSVSPTPNLTVTPTSTPSPTPSTTPIPQ